MNQGTVSAALAVLALLVPPVRGAPPALVPRGNAYRVPVVLDRPAVVGYGVRKFRVLRPVTITSFRPVHVPDGVTVLATRASFLASRSGRAVAGGWPGAICTTTWPPAGFGPSYAVESLAVAAGDTVAFTVYLRVDAPGEYVLDGNEVRYDDGGQDRALREESGQEADITVLAPGEQIDMPPCPLATAQSNAWLAPTTT